MLTVSNAVLTPNEVETGKQFYLSIAVTEVDTSWDKVKTQMLNWEDIKYSYTTWLQVKQR